MDIRTALGELGLSDGEISVYLALLKLGLCPVSKIKEESNLHRTTIYDFLEKLLNKGLISYVVKNKVKYYNAAHPNKLFEFLKEKQDHLDEVLPDLVKLANIEKEEVSVEVYKGKEGMKTVMMDIVKGGHELLGIGIDEALYKKNLPIFMEKYQMMQKEHNLHERLITKINPDDLLDTSHCHYKFVPESSFSPTSTVIYDDKVQIALWEPSLTSIIIKNKKLANAYRNHFEHLWNQESMIFRGEEEVKQMFLHLLEQENLQKDWLVFGTPPISEDLAKFFISTDPILIKKGIKTKIILDEREKRLIDFYNKSPTTTVKVMPKEFMSPSEVDIFGDRVAIVLWENDPMAILIENKHIADSFRQYFQVLWKMAK